MGRGYTDTPTAWLSHKPTIIFKNKVKGEIVLNKHYGMKRYGIVNV
jgi:hypothetical protein